ncbi:MAG: glycosyltransferase [Candidatus Promineifilaceae bacterium]|jgi:glycosyltransferase involved in cell wall biosynthesis
MQQLNILQVTEFFTPRTGGSTQVAFQTARHLACQGHRVTVISSDFGKEDVSFEDDSFGLIQFHSLLTRWKFYVTPGLIPWIRKHIVEYDIIHMHNVRTFQNAVVAEAAIRKQIPYVLSAHGSLPFLIGHHGIKRAFDLLFGRRLLAGASCLIAVSEVEIEQYVNWGIPRGKTAYIPNGLDLNEYSLLPSPRKFRRAYGIPGSEKLILFLGRLHKIKSIDMLLRAFAMLHSSEAAAKLVVAGPDEGELAGLEAIVKQLQLEKYVLFTGPLYGDQKLSAYVDSDIVVMPSKYEIFGLVAFEALMCGTPVLISKSSAAGKKLVDAGAAYAVPHNDPQIMANAILDILKCPAEAAESVARGQSFIRKHLGWESVINDTLALYRSLLGNPVEKLRAINLDETGRHIGDYA